jgi:drug/metabolite transporter (DMT)-like permease
MAHPAPPKASRPHGADLDIEVVFTPAISSLYVRETINRLELFGIAVIVAGVLLSLL